MVKVAVVGAGTMGTVHSHSYANMVGVELVGIADIRPQIGQELARACGTQAYESLDALLQQQDPDVIDVCVPTYLHQTVVRQAAQAGKHVVCEKPLGRTLQDAREIIELCESNHVQLYVGQVVRFFPEYRQIRDLIQSGQVGQVGTARAMRGGGFPRGWNDWYANRALSGSLIVDLMIHDFDYLRWCFGDVERVYAKGLSGTETNRLDHAIVSLRFKNGVIAHVEGTWAYPSGFHTELEIAGETGILAHKSEDATPIHTYLRAEGSASQGVSVPASPLMKSPYQVELEHFMDCISGSKQPIVTAEDAYKALEISLAAVQSIQTKEPVSL